MINVEIVHRSTEIGKQSTYDIKDAMSLAGKEAGICYMKDDYFTRKMVEDDRYCVDISHQLMATEGLLNNANRQVLTAHLKHCVNNADTEEDRNEKVDELINLMSKILK